MNQENRIAHGRSPSLNQETGVAPGAELAASTVTARSFEKGQ